MDVPETPDPPLTLDPTLWLAAAWRSQRRVRDAALERRVAARTVALGADNTVLRANLTGLRADLAAQRGLILWLAHQAFHDALTGLPARALFLDRLEHSMVRARQSGPLAVLFLDLDDFKAVNDRWGHAMGDALLVVVAARLWACLRPGDTVARLGGDEFAVLIETLDADGDVALVTERIAASLGVPFSIDGREIPVTASIGVALRHADHGPADLLREADAAMYRAKSAGKDSMSGNTSAR
jgi:diguanylate cyclase (GGDEF)-like protein